MFHRTPEHEEGFSRMTRAAFV